VVQPPTSITPVGVYTMYVVSWLASWIHGFKTSRSTRWLQNSRVVWRRERVKRQHDPAKKALKHEFGTFLGGFVSKILLDIDIPANFGWKMIQFDERAGFFQMGGEKPPTRYSYT